MRIAADILTALMPFAAPTKPARPHLENLYVTADAKWLCAANGSSLALGAISDGEAVAGKTLSGLDLSQVARAWSKQGDSIIPIAEGLRLDGIVAMTPDDDDSLLVRYVTANPFPDPAGLLRGYPFNASLLSLNGVAVPASQAALVMKAMARATNIYVYGRLGATWFSWQKVGHVAGDFRVLVLGANPAVWPKED